ncbi:MAG: S8 family peptidase [Gemmatimonadota bacterium]
MDVHAPEAWAIQKGSSNVIIGILDTGMEVTHSDFSGKIVGEYDFIHDDGNAFPDAGDRGPHGMGSAGIAAAKTNDGFGVPGMCGGDGSTPGCSVLSVKTIGEGSRWHNFMEWIGASTDAADGGTWAVANGAVVLNNSWCDDVENHALHEAFRNAFQVGTVVTAGMGNNQQNDEGAWDCNQSTSATAVVPAFYSDIVMAVGATDIQGRRVLRDNGFNWESGRGSHIAVVAPGVNHYSDALQNGFQAFGGTSAATPFVSGLAGLVYSEAQAKGLSFTARDNRQLISRTAKDIGDPGYDVETGWGLIRADSALKMLQPPNQVTFASAGTTTSGCSSLTAIQTWTFWSSFVVRNARRCEVRRNITFDVPYQSAPLMWGRAVTGGGVTPSNPNSEVAYTGVVDGSVTTTGATLKTFVYERGRWMVSTWGGGQLSLHK